MTPEQEAVFWRMQNNGSSTRSIAKTIGMYPSALLKWMARRGIRSNVPPYQRVVFTPEMVERFWQLYHGNVKTLIIAETLGVAHQTLRLWMDKQGLPRGDARGLVSASLKSRHFYEVRESTGGVFLNGKDS